MRWYVAQTYPMRAEIAQKELKTKGFPLLIPLMLTFTGQLAPAFPGYIFLRSSTWNLDQARWTRGVRRLLGVGDRPLPVRDAEIAALSALVASGTPLVERAPFAPGDVVKLLDGPFSGFQATVQTLDKTEAQVEAWLFGRSVVITTHTASLAPVA